MRYTGDMAEYSRGILKIVVAQICQIIGWHSINSTPLEFMIDLMQEYLLRLSRLAHQYAEILGRTEANLDDVGLAFQQMNIDIHQLAEYVKNVDSVPCVTAVPKLPIFHDNHLNFLKPGSREVVTRSVHVHEHLPAMNLGIEETPSNELDETCNHETVNGSHHVTELAESNVDPMVINTPSDAVFKRPGNPLSEMPGTSKRTKIMDESRPLREIHSVMMTTSGFLSPAREGKLPESRSPTQARDDSPSPSSYPMVPPELKCDKKFKKLVKKGSEDRKIDKENKKKNREKELFKPDKVNDSKIKTLGTTKDPSKIKATKTGGSKTLASITSSSATCNPQQYSQKEEITGKLSKKNSPKLKSEKIVNAASTIHFEKKENNIQEKLLVEPDKQKLNIFKKISKSRDEKCLEFPDNNKPKETESQSNTSELICGETDHKLVHNDIEIKLDESKTSVMKEEDVFLTNEVVELRSPSSDTYTYDDMSPPGTPSTPKTPELNVPGCPTDQKKKRKDKGNRKKDNTKNFSSRDSVMKIKSSSDTPDIELLDRPKTPDAPDNSLRKESNITSPLSFPFFPAFPSAPGLIPHPIHHSMFPRFPLPLPRGPLNQPSILPNFPIAPRFLPPTPNADIISTTHGKFLDRELQSSAENEKAPNMDSKIDTEKIRKINKISKQDNNPLPQVLEMPDTQYEIRGSNSSTCIPQLSQKLIKSEKNDKKSKKHKIEKKEKLKKKKEKKEKHKEKIEKNKGKKEKIEKLLKIKERKEKKDKRKDKDKEEKESEAVPKITLKLGNAPPSPPILEAGLMKKITIKPLVKKVEDTAKRESSPELAKISALITRPPKQKATRVKQDAVPKKRDVKVERIEGDGTVVEPASAVIDQGGHQVWICPACGNQDDGSPMIGCDDCDAWYHWVCVGMQVPPATNEDWYCRLCIAKKQGLHHDKKKKKRKKKVKVAV